MLDFGTTQNHSNAIDVADRAALDAMASYSMAFQMNYRGTNGLNAHVMAKSNVGDANGWRIRFTAGNVLQILHDNTGGTSSTTTFSAGTTYSVVLTWDGSTAAWNIDDSAAGSASFSTTITANSASLSLGNDDNLSNGGAVALGQVIIWPGYELTSAEITQYHAGQTVPAIAQAEFWYRGTEIPGVDNIRGVGGTKVGTVNDFADPSDAFFPVELTIPQYRQIATHRLLRRASLEDRYQLEVPLHFSKLELMELSNVSHDGLPLSATRLADIETHGLTDQWRRGIMRSIGIEHRPSRRTMVYHFKDHEAFMASFYSSDVLPDGSSQDLDGLSRLDQGAQLTVDRNTKAYLVQPNNIKEEASQNTDGQFYATIGTFQEKINDVGLLPEDSTDNPVLNSAAKNSETSWTGVANSGTLDTSTPRLAFESDVTDRSWRFARANNSSDTYREQAFSVLLADSPRRVYVTYSEEDANSVISWQLQRSTDSFYWNDATPGWQSGAVWNNLANNYNATISRSIIARAFSNPVTISSNQTWTLRMGLEGASLPAGGGEGNVYAISALKGKLVFSEVPTDAAAVTTSADGYKHERTALPQIISSTRGTYSVRVTAVQDGADLDDNVELAIAYWQYGSTDGNDYDVILYQKLSGQNVRFSYERYISGSFDARATFDVSITAGSVYDVTAIWTPASGAELGEDNLLMRILVNDVQGVDGTASAIHSAATAHTEVWRGSAPSATGYSAAMNYVSIHRARPRAVTNEERVV